MARQKFVNDTFEKINEKYGSRTIGFQDLLCPRDRCEVQFAGVSLYRDSDHISNQGAMILRPALAPVFKRLAFAEKDNKNSAKLIDETSLAPSR